MRNKTGLLRRLCCAVLGLLLAGLTCVLPAHAAGENTTYTYTLMGTMNGPSSSAHAMRTVWQASTTACSCVVLRS